MDIYYMTAPLPIDLLQEVFMQLQKDFEMYKHNLLEMCLCQVTAMLKLLKEGNGRNMKFRIEQVEKLNSIIENQIPQPWHVTMQIIEELANLETE